MEQNISYSVQMKREILQNKIWRTSYKNQLTCGMVKFSQSYSPEEMYISVREEQVARFYKEIIPEAVHLKGEITFSELDLGDMKTYTASVDDIRDRVEVLNHFSMLYPEGVTFDLVGGDTGTAAFLAGAFLACGALSNPQKDYHLEFAPAGGEQLSELYNLLSDVGFIPKKAVRRGQDFIYFHDSRQIEDLLTFLGCPKLSMEIMGVKILKERRNTANRLSNCDTANIDKTVNAAAKQTAAINKLFKARGKENLPEELAEIAEIRLKYPELSLRELGTMVNPPLSRSGVNHRLQKLLDLAESIPDEE